MGPVPFSPPRAFFLSPPQFPSLPSRARAKEEDGRIIHGILNASWKICSLVVNGQSFLVIDGYLQNLFWN